MNRINAYKRFAKFLNFSFQNILVAAKGMKVLEQSKIKLAKSILLYRNLATKRQKPLISCIELRLPCALDVR